MMSCLAPWRVALLRCALAMLVSGKALAQASAPAPATLTAGAGGNVMQVLIGLVGVIALVLLAGWLLKRFSLVPGSSGGPIRILGGASVGPRERIVLVEVADTWLVVGVAPGQVRALHSMPRGELPLAQNALGAQGASSFAALLRRLAEGRKNV